MTQRRNSGRIAVSRARPCSLLLVLVLLASWTQPAAAQDQVPTGVDGTTYTGPNFGYWISWEGDYWEVTGSAAGDDQGDSLKFRVQDPGAGLLEMGWFTWDPSQDAEDYVAGFAENLNVPSVTDLHQAEANGR